MKQIQTDDWHVILKALGMGPDPTLPEPTISEVCERIELLQRLLEDARCDQSWPLTEIKNRPGQLFDSSVASSIDWEGERLYYTKAGTWILSPGREKRDDPCEYGEISRRDALRWLSHAGVLNDSTSSVSHEIKAKP